MPSSATITSFYSFTENTRARASQVNTNFSNFRGHFIPVEVLTATSSDNTYDLGSDEHRWRTVYTNSIDLETSTSTASLTISGDGTTATGAFLFKIEGVTKGRINNSGIVGADVNALPNTSFQTSTAYPTMYSQTFTANGSFTIPAWCDVIFVSGWGAGGGGAGGSAAQGGGGGAGGGHWAGPISVTPGSVYSITSGVPGNGGAAAADGSTGTTMDLTGEGNTWYWMGGHPGRTGGTGGSSVMGSYGGNGGNAAAGSSGGNSAMSFGGGGGGTSGGYGGGGGGGAGYGKSGAGGGGGGGAGAATGNPGTQGTVYGSGGGGGGGAAGGAQGAGAAGAASILTISWVRPKGG